MSITWVALVFTGARREKFPYPEFRPKPEHPRPLTPPPPPPPPPRPRPRPLAWAPPNIRDPALLVKIRAPRRLVHTVLERFPHPDDKWRVQWSAISEMDLEPKLRRGILMVQYVVSMNPVYKLNLPTDIPPG